MNLLSHINQFLWGVPALIILLGTGLYLTFILRGVQFRWFKHAIALVLGSVNRKADHVLQKPQGEISHFQALATGLSGTIGTGNIAGVATAIVMGGPGAIFWMWISAILGMATKFASCTLALKFREVEPSGHIAGGPMYTLLHGLKKPWLAKAFAIFTAIAAFGIGNTVQANSIVDGLEYAFPGSEHFTFITGLILCVLVGVVIIGGIKRIGKLAGFVVPFMGGGYLLLSFIVLALYFKQIPHAFALIFWGAFSFKAGAGGVLGAAMHYGMARGVFSNEAGLGSTAMAHAAAQTDEPVREGFVAMLEPFFDTIVICTITALVILVTGYWQTQIGNTQDSAGIAAGAFSQGLGSYWGAVFVGIGIIFFAYTSMLSWSYYGDRAICFLFGERYVRWYQVVFIIMIFFGSIAPLSLVWQFADVANILMAIPNVISIWLLSGMLKRMLREYV